MNYIKINENDIANGEGVRVSLFVSGCRRRCKGCFNKETWDFNAGKPFTIDTLNILLGALAKQHIAGLSVLGGEPLEQENIGTLYDILSTVKMWFPEKTIWLYTGYKYEDVRDARLLDWVDVLVDGEFIEEQKDISLSFRGSRNQRIIELKKENKE